MSHPIDRVNRSNSTKLLLLLGPIAVALSLLLFQISAVRSAAGLTVTILAGYNLVVDSNVESASTASPSVATVAAKFCNPGPDTLKDVTGYIGDYTGSLSTSTPGAYPTRNSSDAGFIALHPRLANSGLYAFSHLGDAPDASRFIGDLGPGQCSVQYWSFQYPRCENNENPPCTGDAVFGVSNNLADDLYLYFDVWGQGTDATIPPTTIVTAAAPYKLTMRGEISSNANKIWPNPDGTWFNTNASTVLPGDVITSNGVNYTFGNVSGGFDNDGNGSPDNNAWVQPFGDPTYDPTCFRLIRTTGVLTVSLTGGNPDLILPFVDQLYFSLPANNNGVVGEVRYTFLALDGPCIADMSPYQEAASGSNNEKFNSDYGAPVPPLASYAPAVTVGKTATPSVAEGGNITYNIAFANTGNAPIGLTPASGIPANMPFVIQDTVPDGLSYICDSDDLTLSFAGGYTPLFSKDSGLTWSSDENTLWPECATPGTPTHQVSAGPNNRIVIQWRLTVPLPPGGTGTATFLARVPSGYIAGGGSTLVENTACIKLDHANNTLGCASDTTLVQGPNTLDGTVFFDQVLQDGVRQPGDTTTFAGITINLWFCGPDGNCATSADNFFVGSTVTDSSGGYLFSNLPDGVYSVSIDTSAPSISLLSLTSPSPQSADLDPQHQSALGVSATRDFGLYAHMDCGDLPNPYNYPTTIDQQGPCHVSPSPTAPPPLFLGAVWDNDFNGQGTTGQATGDDNTGLDDEDGVEPILFGTWYTSGPHQISVNVTGVNGFLVGWFDWNEDHDFVDGGGGYDPLEFQILGPVGPGVNLRDVFVPPLDCTTPATFCFDNYDTLYARFRLYSGPPPLINHAGLVVGGEVEDYQFANAPTAVSLAGFSATFRPTHVVVAWQTVSEFDAIGFNVLRSTSPDGGWVQINDELIPSQMLGGAGGFYEFLDPDVQPGVIYYYRLEFVDTSGATIVAQAQVLVQYSLFMPFVRK